MDFVAAMAGLICASAIFLYSSRLDRSQEAVAELGPLEEAQTLPLRRRGFGYRLDRLGRRLFGDRVSAERRSNLQVRLNLAGNPGHLTPAAFEAIRYGAAALLVALRVQAAELRRTRRASAQERAAQASLRMVFPLVGCIFPTIWIILLGPALLGLVKAWH